jgi:hypothetical protein
MEKELLDFSKYQETALKITKLEDKRFFGSHPHEINEGYTRTGTLHLELSNKHQCLFILDGPDRYFHTSMVVKMEEHEGYDLLTTVNSVYKVEQNKKKYPAKLGDPK